MLVITRRIGERIQIGPDVFIAVIRTSPTRAVLGIVAPDSIKIVREEVCKYDDYDRDKKAHVE